MSDDLSLPQTALLPTPAVGKAVAVCRGVWWGRLPLPAPAVDVNVYLLRDVDGWVLVDTGCRTKECRLALKAILHEVGARNKEITRVIVTHHHPDHLGLAAEFQANGAEVFASSECHQASRHCTKETSERLASKRLDLARVAGLVGVQLEAYRRQPPSRFPAPEPLAAERCRVLTHRETLKYDGRSWQVFMGDGHALGHVTLWSDDGLAISGDHFLLGITTNLSVNPSDSNADPVTAFEESNAEMLSVADEETLILPGHNSPFTNVKARWHQIRSSRASLLERLLSSLSRPKTALECLDTVHRRTLQPHERVSLLSECLGHLNHLRNQGLISEVLQSSGAKLWRRAEEPLLYRVDRTETQSTRKLQRPPLSTLNTHKA